MIESDSMPTIGHWALRIPTSSISKGNHIGFEACDNSEQGKMPRWGREKALWVPSVRFLNAANKCLEVATSNLAISYCCEAAQDFITAPSCFDPKFAAACDSRKMWQLRILISTKTWEASSRISISTVSKQNHMSEQA